MFELNLQGKHHYYVVMDNLLYGLNPQNLKTYDLKGSESNR